MYHTTCNSMKLTSVPIIAYNSNVHFARNDHSSDYDTVTYVDIAFTYSSKVIVLLVNLFHLLHLPFLLHFYCLWLWDCSTCKLADGHLDHSLFPLRLRRFCR